MNVNTVDFYDAVQYLTHDITKSTAMTTVIRLPGPWFNIKMSSYQYRKSHCGNKTVVRSSYLHNGISYTAKMTSLYWFGPQPIKARWHGGWKILHTHLSSLAKLLICVGNSITHDTGLPLCPFCPSVALTSNIHPECCQANNKVMLARPTLRRHRL